uniref:Uncharacterized protein n=1 Tax=Meloidogyne floridensis TaxID=298350 RepID=A0A915NUK9_9BILA
LLWPFLKEEKPAKAPTDAKTMVIKEESSKATSKVETPKINKWESINQLGRLPSLEKLNFRGTLLFGSRGVESREIVIAKLPKIVFIFL